MIKPKNLKPIKYFIIFSKNVILSFNFIITSKVVNLS
jgi:hypothetical protein